MLRRAAVLILGAMAANSASGSDWPAYHCDAQRSGYTSEAVPGELKLAWSLELPHAPTPAWSRNGRIRYDDVFQPVVVGGSVYFGNHVEGMLWAIDLKTGHQRWRFQTGGPIRCAPTLWKDTVIVGSDDGRIYSLKASDGSVRWSIRPGPCDELVLGNEYMISKWPVRGAPTVEGDTVYVGAGIWPSDGFYLLAIDADTGEIKWRNDDSGNLSIRQPHAAISKAGPAAQGYLTLSATSILVPPGRSLPAMFDKKTGRFRYIRFGGKIGGGVSMTHKDTYTCAGVLWTIGDSRLIQRYLPMKRTSEWPMIETLPHDAMTPGGIVAARESHVQSFKWVTKQRAVRRDGKVLGTENYTSLDNDWGVEASGPVSELIVAGDRVILGLDGAIEMIDRQTHEKIRVADELDGVVGGLAYANGYLIASTTTGRIYVYAADGLGAKATTKCISRTPPTIDAATIRSAKAIIEAAGIAKGYAVDLGCGDGSLSVALTQLSDLKVIAVETDKAIFIKARDRLQKAGLYGTRVMIFNRPLDSTGLPNMLANLIVSKEAELKGRILTEARRLQRPYGGAICEHEGDKISIERRGAINGGGSWTHQYANPANTLCSDDAALSGKLTMLWYRDYDLPSTNRWFRGVSPLAADGLLYQACPGGVIAVDAYNGTEIWRFDSKDLVSARAGYSAYRTGGVYCLGDGMLYLRRNAQCLCLNAKTGELVRTISLPDPKSPDPKSPDPKSPDPKSPDPKSPDPKSHDFWGYLAYSDGILYGTAANTNHTTINPYPFDSRGVIEGKTLFAVDAATGRVLWQFEPKDHIGNNAVAIDSRSVYLIDRPSLWADRSNLLNPRRGNPRRGEPLPPGKLVALDKKTGKQRWTTDSQVFGSAVLLSKSAGRVCIWHQEKLVGFDVESGKRVYNIKSSYGLDKYGVRVPLIAGDVIYWHRRAFDVRSGEKLAQELLRSYGCGSISASRNMLFFRSGTIGYVDLRTPRANPNKITTADIQNFGGIRPGCYINTIPAGGVVLIPDSSSSCACSYFNQCWLALQPAVAIENEN